MNRTSAISKTAVLAVTATTLMMFPAAAQQIAANRTAPPDYSRCDAMREANPKGAIICRVEVIQAHTRQLQQEAAIARQQSFAAEDGVRTEAQLSNCISFLTARKASGVTFDRPITRENACAVARQLGMTNG